MTRPHADERQPLTPRQAQWLEAVREHYARTGTAPTLQRLADIMDVSGISAAALMLRRLARRGDLVAIEQPSGSGRFKYVPADTPGGQLSTSGSPRMARLVGRLRRQAAELRKRAAEIERIAAELESGGLAEGRGNRKASAKTRKT